MQIIIIRHAEAFQIGERGLTTDAHRMLTPKGHKDARRLGKALAVVGVVPDLVLTSPLVRAVETAENVIRGASWPGPLRETEHLMPPGAEKLLMREILDVAKGRGGAFGDMTVACVGHEPFLGQWLQFLLNETTIPAIEMSKSTAACVKISEDDSPQMKLLISRKLAKLIVR